MEAPEKIYIQPRTIEQLPHQNIVYTKPLADNSIEYIRANAFIEKACNFLQEEVLDDYSGIVWEGIIEDFKNYMKGN